MLKGVHKFTSIKSDRCTDIVSGWSDRNSPRKRKKKLKDWDADNHRNSVYNGFNITPLSLVPQNLFQNKLTLIFARLAANKVHDHN